MMKPLSYVTLFAVSLLAGCGKLRYEIVAPASARGEIAPNAGVVMSREGIDYEVFELQGKVIFHFLNKTGESVRLTNESLMFDSTGQSFAMETMALAPDQSGRIVVPPGNPVARGPRSPISAGVRFGGYDEGGMIRDERSAYGSAPMARDFRWPAGTNARFRFVFAVGEKSIAQEWTLRREKVN